MPFLWSLLYVYINSHDHIMEKPIDIFDNDLFLLHDNMTEPLTLKKKTISTCNRPFITVVSFAMLYYAQSKWSNLLQRVIRQFTFANNISKRYIELFYQISMIVLYKFIQCGLAVNTNVIIDEIINKTYFR